MKKKATRLLALILLLVLCLPTAAALAAPRSAPQPRWVAISTFQCAMHAKSGLFTNANPVAEVHTSNSNYRITLTVTVQKWQGSDFVDTDTSWSTSGTAAVRIDKSIKLSDGEFRTKAVAVVTTSAGAYLETVTVYSSSQYF